MNTFVSTLFVRQKRKKEKKKEKPNKEPYKQFRISSNKSQSLNSRGKESIHDRQKSSLSKINTADQVMERGGIIRN